MSIRRSVLSFLVAWLLPLSLAWGQAARSPFSSYGLGEQYGTALAQSQGMGGVGFSNPQFLSINNQNPAMLVYNRLTTFQAGVIGETRTQHAENVTEKSGSGNLNYLALAVPVISGWWSTSFGLMPYTRLNYSLYYTAPISGSPDNAAILEEGTGGINQFYWSNGVSLTKSLSVGIKTAYLFSASTSASSNLIKSPIPISAQVIDRTFISDFVFSPAIHLHLDSVGAKNYRINVGVIYDIKTDLNAQFNRIMARRNALGNLIDSVTVTSNVPGTLTMPGNLMVGMSFSPAPYKWMAAVDASFADYSQYRDLEGKNIYESNSWRIAGGFEFTPDRTNLSNYLKRMTYRTGVSIENYPFLANGNTVKDFGITFGVSLPVNRISSLDLAMKWGRKGDVATNAMEENYFKIYFGITFNDQWFIKRRFD